MIPRLNRLPTTRLVSSQLITTPLFTLRFSKNAFTYPRFSFVVSKKIDKRAIVRNRLKRVLREIAYREMLGTQSGVDLLFIVKKNFSEMPRQEVEAIVSHALEQMSL